MSHVVLHTDGGARGNPGPAAIGVVVEIERDGTRELVEEIADRIGVATNNVAEYRALIRGLEEARRVGATEVDCLLDSQLVVEQLGGRYKVKHPNVVGLHQQATDLARHFQRVTFRHIPRADNAEADRLVNAALDGRLVAGGVAGGGGDAADAGPSPEPSWPAPAPDRGRTALEEVRRAYYTAADLADADLDAVNRKRPPGMRYDSHRQLVREGLLMAAAQADFAVRLQLINADDLKAFLHEFWAEQPDLVSQEDEAWIQQDLDLTSAAAE